MAETVTRQSSPDRYQIDVDEGTAGFTQFVDHDGQRIFFHTEIGEEFGGRGLAGTLVKQALDATRDEGLRIVPMCPYVKKYVGTHHDWDDILDPVTPAAIQVVQNR
ncbi:GNAT family N-acetyltransferase [Janibacter sp. GXQ6167]|uniref:GNAT family N-acetyltransferase n=1 Tax=Janibacter sp. GXQ6167 TaxID=3240791 RepID=UPI0035234A24